MIFNEGKKKQAEERWKRFRELVSFTEEELAVYRSYEPHKRAMEDAPLFSTHYLEIEVIEARNCAAGYRKGDKFFVDSYGFLIKEKCPEKLCVGAIFAFKLLVDRMWEAFLNNSTEVLHNTIRCPDVGVNLGGVGEITMRIRAIPKGRDRGDNADFGKILP